MVAETAHSIANRLLAASKLPELNGPVTDADVWPHLSNALGKMIIVMDGVSMGWMFQPSQMIFPGETIQVISDGCIHNGQPISLGEALLMLRTGYGEYELLRSMETFIRIHESCHKRDAQRLAERVSFQQIHPAVFHMIDADLRTWLHRVLQETVAVTNKNGRRTITHMDVSIALSSFRRG